MDSSPSAAPAAKSLFTKLDVEEEIGNFAAKTNSNQPSQAEVDAPASQVENDIERIRSSVARLTLTSIDGLENLTSELQELKRLVKSEVERVQCEIDSALAGIKIITEAIAPWKSSAPVSQTPSVSTRAVRGGPAALLNGDGAQSRR